MNKVPEYNEFREAVIKKLIHEYDGYGRGEKEIRELLEIQKYEKAMKRFYNVRLQDEINEEEDLQKTVRYVVGLAANYFVMCW